MVFYNTYSPYLLNHPNKSSLYKTSLGVTMGPGPSTHQALLDEQAEEDRVAHLPQVLEAHCL